MGVWGDVRRRILAEPTLVVVTVVVVVVVVEVSCRKRDTAVSEGGETRARYRYQD